MFAVGAKGVPSVDVAHGEMVEAELDAFIERRARKGDVDPDEREELWKESVRAYTARQREEMRAARCASTTRARPHATGPSSRP